MHKNHPHKSAKTLKRLLSLFLSLFLYPRFLCAGVAQAETGLDFPGSVGVTTTMRFVFANPQNNGLPIYGPGGNGVTYIWRAYPREQPSYYTTFFWGNDDGQGNLYTFFWDHTNANTFYGAHPYPVPHPIGDVHYWEIATDVGGDYLSTEEVVFDRWYTQALVVWADGSDRKHSIFYWDLPDTGIFVEHTTAPGYGDTDPPAPALTFGDAPWNPGNEVYNGILRGFRVYATKLSESDILAEAAAPLSTPAGAANIWYLNMNPTPTDISDKSGAGHHPAWVGSERPSLYQSSTLVLPNPPSNLIVQ
jgi:hypothetical protein